MAGDSILLISPRGEIECFCEIGLICLRRMGKVRPLVKTLPNIESAKQEAIEALDESLGRFGEFLERQWVARVIGTPSDPGYDLKLRFRITKGAGRGNTWWIHTVIKTVLHPKQASHAIWLLKKSLGKTVRDTSVYPLLIAPFISKSVAAMCEEAGIGYLDFAGNCNIEFGGVWIERQGRPRKYKEERGHKSLFAPKASRLLHVLLQGPLRSHKVEDLAKAANVSLGLVSKVRQVLLNEELAEVSNDGIRITRPDEILRDWIMADDFSLRAQVREYSTLASDFTLAGNLLVFCAAHSSVSDVEPIFTLNFAASLRAPHNIPTTVSAYLDRFPDEHGLFLSLNARPVSRGAGNLRILVPSDYKAVMIGKQHVKNAPEFPLVSDLQLYLDLHGGETNGPEQASILRNLSDFNGGWS